MRPALTDRQIARMQWRIGRFIRYGLTEDAADKLADRLADRDHERDDRRCCFECSQLQTPGTCFAAQQGRIPHTSRHTDFRAFMPVRDVLQRCEGFEFATPA